MDGDGIFDLEGIHGKDSVPITTAWSSRVEPRSKGRKAFGRRGSNAFSANRTMKGVFPVQSKERKQNINDEDLEGAEPINQWNIVRSPGDDFSGPPLPPPRQLKKSKTISGQSPATSNPSLPPMIMRANSLSGMVPTRRRSSFSNRSASTGSSFSSLSTENENFHPNFDGRNIMEDTSPKRSAVVEVNKKGRKKCKPTNLAFMQRNDFTSLNPFGKDGNDNHGSEKMQTLGSFSDIARNYHEQADPVWLANSTSSLPPTYSESDEDVNRRRSYSAGFLSPSPIHYQDESIDNTDFVLSPTASTASSSTRKRGACKSHFFTDDSPVVRSRSRIMSPLPDRTPELPILLHSVDSKPRSTGLMDISFSPKDREYTLSDDDVTDDSDISFDNEHENVDTFGFKGINHPPSTRSARGFEPEKASPDDVVNYMSSFEDIKFMTDALKQNFEGQRGFATWSIAPPLSWSAKRRDTFFHGARKLGFTFRSGGGNVAYIQISKTRGSKLLPLLKSTLATYDEHKGRQRLLGSETKSAQKVFMFSSAIKKDARVSNGMRLTPKELTSNSWRRTSVDRSTDELTNIMSQLDMNAKPSANINREIREDILFNVNDCFESHRPSGSYKSRTSSEYHSNSSDLNAQMQGRTPVPPKLKGRLPRLSIQNDPCGTTIPTNLDISNCNANSNEFVFTPSIGRQNNWGSRPFNGRDWGISDCCDAGIIDRLSKMFEQTQEGSGQAEPMNPESSCVGLDFESVSQYCDEFESPSSSSLFGDTEMHEFSSAQRGTFFSDKKDIDTMRMDAPFSSRAERRRQTTLAKHRRISLVASAVNPTETFSKQRKSLFVRKPSLFSARKQKIFTDSAPEFFSQHSSVDIDEYVSPRSISYHESPVEDSDILRMIFDFLGENELLSVVGLVSRKWADAATHSHANLMMLSVAPCGTERLDERNAAIAALRRSWDYMMTTFPWACFLSEGAFKRVYKVFNHTRQEEEAVSVMDVKQIHSTGNINVVKAELAVSVMLSSLVRRGICPNFVAIRGMFSSEYEPPDNYWGTADNKRPKGPAYSPSKIRRKPREPKHSGNFQYIRMELCGEGDAEEFLKRQPNESLVPVQARNMLFQIAFALYAAAEKFSLKHYDVKLLNIFLQRMPQKNDGNVILRYGLGGHTFALESSREDAIIAKLADYGTANVDCTTNGQNVTIAQFTTLENTPPDFLILGDSAVQGHGHDCFGLGLCMLHLFTGHAPYEEILEEITCPINFKKELRRIWENEDETQYSVVRSIILADVFKDEDGNVIEGEADDTLYDTLYRYLVLFGIPDDSPTLSNSKVMAAIRTTLLSEGRQKKGRGRNRKNLCDTKTFVTDCNKFSLSHGNNKYISRARMSLSSMDGGMDLLMSLVKFDPQYRASALNVLNSDFMAPLREIPNDAPCDNGPSEVFSYTAFST